MSLFGKLFQKNSPQDFSSLKARADTAKDPVSLCRACYQLGVWYMDHGDPERAMLWLSRADTVYSARDEIYETVGEKLTDDCSDRIGALEDAPTLVNTLTQEVTGLAEDAEESVVCLWGLMSMARLSKLGGHLGTLPGCQGLGRLYRAVDLAAQSFRGPISREEFDQMGTIRDQLYELSDSSDFWAGGEIALPGRAPFQVFDLNGSGALLSMNLFLDSHMRRITASDSQAETDIITCALLADYYLRTQEGRLQDMPAAQEEARRIRDDYAFLKDHPPIEEVLARVEAYKSMDLPV